MHLLVINYINGQLVETVLWNLVINIYIEWSVLPNFRSTFMWSADSFLSEIIYTTNYSSIVSHVTLK